jgi:C1A family cysteine protease
MSMTGDWLREREDYAFLRSLPAAPMFTAAWRAFSRPAEIDISWHKTEDQSQLGSCQGHSVSSVLERLAHVNGESVQLSEIFAYLATQKIDGLLGSDRGSTISGGCKMAVQFGCPPETNTGYPRAYPGSAARAAILSEKNYKDAEPYKAKSAWQVPQDHDALLDFIGGGGGINFGITYYSNLIPSDRIVRAYNPPRNGGGHAMCILGYDRNGNLRAANSHADGPYLITPNAWRTMLQHQWTAAIGLMGNPEAKPVDWYNNSPYFKLQERPDDEKTEDKP